MRPQRADQVPDPRARPRSISATKHDAVAALGQSSVHRRGGILFALASSVAGLAAWYGLLEARHHPSLKLGGAMALAGVAIALLMTARPVHSDQGAPAAHQHPALTELHPALFGIACASMSAAIIHFAVIEQHLAEYWAYGWFFVVVGTAQLVWAVLAVLKPFRLLFIVGAIGNALVVLAWIVTRAYGSLIGPAATMKAMAGFGDIVSTILEAAIVVGCVVLLAQPRLLGLRRDHAPTDVVNSLIAIGIVLLTSLSLYSAVGGQPFVSHVG